MDVDKIQTVAQSWPEKARAIKITGPAEYAEAGEMLKGIKVLRREVDAAFDPIIQKAHAAHKEAIAQKSKVEAPLTEADTILRRGLAVYTQEEERKRRAEEARLRELARKAEEERMLAEAQMLADMGQHEQAEAVLSEPVFAAPVVLPKETPKVAGVFHREDWKFRIVNAALIPRGYLIPDEKSIGAVVRASQGKIQIPGIEAYCEKSTGVR